VNLVKDDEIRIVIFVKYEDVIKEIAEQFPDFELKAKEDSSFMKLLSFFFRIISFGKVDNFLTQYTITIGRRIYLPKNWFLLPDKYKASILRHELVHMRQMKKYTLPVFLFVYLLLPFPLFLSWFRARLEWEAYEESLRDEYELHGTKYLLSEEYKTSIVELFTGPAYGWMWPFRKRVEKWYDDAVKKIIGR
jgi:hypothetical protein